MRHSSYLYVGMFLIACSTHIIAQDVETSTTDINTTNTVPHDSRTAAAIKKLTVNANAAQSEDDKDPFQPLNRQIYAMNDYLDIHIARPLADGPRLRKAKRSQSRIQCLWEARPSMLCGPSISTL